MKIIKEQIVDKEMAHRFPGMVDQLGVDIERDLANALLFHLKTGEKIVRLGDLKRSEYMETKQFVLRQSIDLKDVIHCIDCGLRIEDEGDLWCQGWGWPARMVHENGYCYKGERKEDE